MYTIKEKFEYDSTKIGFFASFEICKLLNITVILKKYNSIVNNYL